MISKKNKENAREASSRNAGRSIVRRLLLCLGLFLSIAASGQTYNFVAVPWVNNQVADGSAQDLIQVYVTYASGPNAGQAANGVTVSFSLPPLTASSAMTTGPASGFANGYAYYPVSNTVAGSLTVDVTINGVTQPVSINFIPAPVNNNPGPNPSTYTTIIGSATANGSDTAVVQVHATDGTNNEPPGTPVEFIIVGGSGSAQTSASFNGTSVTPGTPYVVPGGLGQNGSLDLPITSPNPGSVQVEALVWNGSTWVEIGSPQTVTFVVPPPSNNPPPGSPNPSYYTTIIATATADNTDTAVVRLHITDGTNNEPDGYKVEFQITSNTTGGNATMTGTGGTTSTSTLQTVLATNANGSIDIPVTDPKAGQVTIAAYAWDPVTNAYDIPFGSQTVNFVAAPPTNNPPPGSPNPSYYITIIPQATANNSDTAVVQLHITDGTNNEPDGYKVEFVITANTTGASATMTGTGGVTATGTVGTALNTVLATNANGSIDIPVTDPKVGSVTIAAYAWDAATNAYDIPFGTQTVNFVAAPPTNNPPPGSPNPSYYITIIPQATANNTDTAVVQLHITDGTNNEPDGYKVEFTITANTTGGNATMTGTGGTTSTSTLQTVLATNANGSIDIPVTDPKVGSVTIAAYAWDAATNAYDIPFGTQTVTFIAGQPVTGDPGGPSDGGDPGGGSPGNGGTPPGGGGNNGGGGGNSGGGGDPGTNNGFTEIYVLSQYNDRLSDGQQQDSVYVYITDANKNPVAGVTVTFYIANPGGTITTGEQWTAGQTTSPITATTGADGIARVAMTSTTPGSVWVYASIIDPTTNAPALVAHSDVEVDFVTKPDITNIQTALTVIVGEALADGTQQNVVKAHVVDLDGNVMANQQVYFAIDSGTGTIVTPQPVTTDANGDAFIQITSKTVGYVLITATVDSEKIVFGSPARVYFAMINIYVPRAFSPNNDGTNDLLKPILVGISTFHYFNVYNRWGNLIFTTQDPNQGWDGTFKGVPQPVETYLWIAEGIDENGHKVVQKGMTSLVR
jgi:gliding motility-associated-like protein